MPDYQKLPQFNLLEFGRKEVLKTERKISLENSHKNLADELLFLGLYDEATPELEKSFSENPAPKTDDQNYTLAVFYKRGDMAYRAVAFAEPLWKKVPADYEIELDSARLARTALSRALCRFAFEICAAEKC